MVADRPGAGRQKERTFLQATQMPCRGSSYFSTIYFSLRWSESKKGSFSFSAFLSLLWGYWDSRCCLPGRRREEAREEEGLPPPSSIGCTSQSLSLRGNTAEESLSGIKYKTRRESKAPAGRASLADHAADTSLAKVNLSPGAAHGRKSRSACRTDWKLKVRCLALRLGAALCARACSQRGNTDSRLAISLRCIMLKFFCCC